MDSEQDCNTAATVGVKKNIVLVKKTGEMKNTFVKNFTRENLYKKCGYKSDTGFVCVAEWRGDPETPVGDFNVSVYGKTVGKSGSENRHKILPLINKIIYGDFAIVSNDSDLTVAEWEKISSYLSGGVEEIIKSTTADEVEIQVKDDEKISPEEMIFRDGFQTNNDDSDSELQNEEYLLYSDEEN